MSDTFHLYNQLPSELQLAILENCSVLDLWCARGVSRAFGANAISIATSRREAASATLNKITATQEPDKVKIEIIKKAALADPAVALEIFSYKDANCKHLSERIAYVEAIGDAHKEDKQAIYEIAIHKWLAADKIDAFDRLHRKAKSLGIAVQLNTRLLNQKATQYVMEDKRYYCAMLVKKGAQPDQTALNEKANQYLAKGDLRDYQQTLDLGAERDQTALNEKANQYLAKNTLLDYQRTLDLGAERDQTALNKKATQYVMEDNAHCCAMLVKQYGAQPDQRVLNQKAAQYRAEDKQYLFKKITDLLKATASETPQDTTTLVMRGPR